MPKTSGLSELALTDHPRPPHRDYSLVALNTRSFTHVTFNENNPRIRVQTEPLEPKPHSPLASVVRSQHGLEVLEPARAEPALDEPLNVRLGLLLLRVVRLGEALPVEHQPTCTVRQTEDDSKTVYDSVKTSRPRSHRTWCTLQLWVSLWSIRAVPENREFKKWKFSFFCQRHALSPILTNMWSPHKLFAKTHGHAIIF